MLIVAMVIASALYMETSAQHIAKRRVGTYSENGAVVMSDATTTFMVKVVVEYEEFEAGPYARYAQKLLGSRASFVDRAEYRVVAADVAIVDNDNHAFVADFDKYRGYLPTCQGPCFSVALCVKNHYIMLILHYWFFH